MSKKNGNIYKKLWDRAPVAYHTLNTKGVITRVNLTELKMLGYKDYEMIGKPIFDFILKSQRKRARDRFKMKISGKYLSQKEDRIYIKKDGSEVHVIINDVLERDEEGRVIGIWTTMADVTYQKNLEHRLIESYQHLGHINRRLSMLSELTYISKRSKERIIKYVLSSALNISNAAQAMYYQNKSDSFFSLVSAINIESEEKKKINKIKSKHFLKLFNHKQEHKVNNFARSQLGTVLNSSHYRHYLALPLTRKNNLKGFILLSFLSKPFLSHQELDFYDLFAFHAASAFKNADIF